MELRHVRVFLTLAEELHFGRTAARLHVAQSAVSQTLKALEAEVGATLFVRTKRSVALSAAGATFAAHAQAASRELARGALMARRVGEGTTGRLTLGFVSMAALTRLPGLVTRFRAEHPGVDVRILPGGSRDQLSLLQRGALDLAFVTKSTSVGPLASMPVEEAPLVVLLGRDHPFASRRSIGFEALVGERWLLPTQRNEPQIHRAWRARLGADADIALETDQLETLLAFVAEGYGVSVAPAFIARLNFPDVACVPLTPSVRGGTCAVWDPVNISPVARRFLDGLRAEGAASAGKRRATRRR